MSYDVSAAVPPAKVEKLKRFALAPTPFDGVMSYDDALAKAQQQIFEGKAKKFYVLEIVGVVEPITRVVDFVEEN